LLRDDDSRVLPAFVIPALIQFEEIVAVAGQERPAMPDGERKVLFIGETDGTHTPSALRLVASRPEQFDQTV
jgi:hypothetical protein